MVKMYLGINEFNQYFTTLIINLKTFKNHVTQILHDIQKYVIIKLKGINHYVMLEIIRLLCIRNQKYAIPNIFGKAPL